VIRLKKLRWGVKLEIKEEWRRGRGERHDWMGAQGHREECASLGGDGTGGVRWRDEVGGMEQRVLEEEVSDGSLGRGTRGAKELVREENGC